MTKIPRKYCNLIGRIEKFQSEWHSVVVVVDDDNNNNDKTLSLQFIRKTELLFCKGNQ
jgi:RNA polymerase subunit RPABC4/transcription elongation factor Spt4